MSTTWHFVEFIYIYNILMKDLYSNEELSGNNNVWYQWIVWTCVDTLSGPNKSFPSNFLLLKSLFRIQAD